MKIAVCFSGMIRAGLYASDNLRLFLGEHYGDCVFFLHTWRQQSDRPPRLDITQSPMRRHQFRPLNNDDLKFITNTHPFSSYRVDDFDSINLPGMKIGPLWLSWYESIKIKQDYEKRHNFKFDYVFKLRPDIIFRTDCKLKDLLGKVDANNFCFPEYFPREIGGKTIQSVDDVFWISNSRVMDTAANFVKLTAYNILPHDNFYNYLSAQGIECTNLGYSYWRDFKHTILRSECLHYDPILDFSKCEECNKRIHYPQNVDTNFMSKSEIIDLYEKIGYPLDAN